MRIILINHRSVRELYNKIKQQWREKKEYFSYSQFTRYIKGEISIPTIKEDFFIRFIHNELNLVNDLIKPYIDINLDMQPIYIDMTRLFAYPDRLNLLAFHVISQDHLKGKFDALLTHPGAIPISIAFSQILELPWYSISFRTPTLDSSQITQYPYLIDQELVATAFFSAEKELRNKKILIVSDYIRRGGFIDILFNVAEDNTASIEFLVSIIGIGNAWKRFHTELEGNVRVLHFL